jgi:hypothetical protein
MRGGLSGVEAATKYQNMMGIGNECLTTWSKPGEEAEDEVNVWKH